ncbi:MAG: arsenosugar biosynthesis radical SAM protein ArsS [Planctomycetes bacterium]|nr:arsenosugar biosynthesis radical SAM protein ArsS [Planctomycetota bacterium]
MAPTLARRGHELAQAQAQLERLRALPLARDFDTACASAGHAPLRATRLEILQVNLGKVCNQTCKHCHVDAGPDRKESMGDAVVEQCLALLAAESIPTLDITGGAPEMHPRFREIVRRARATGAKVIDRCNLTITQAQGFTDLPEFLAAHQVEIVASLPFYSGKQTDAQRGDGVFEPSIAALRRLNELGYGKGGGLVLNLVTNPVGAFLPAGQASLEREWKRELERRHGVLFDRLFTITNMPISRFLDFLSESGNLAGYMEKLVAAFNPAAVDGLMCRNTLSVGWDGRLFDCDFNQMLEMALTSADGRPLTLADAARARLEGRPILTAPHCFGCTAGAGSSCGGATVKG